MSRNEFQETKVSENVVEFICRTKADNLREKIIKAIVFLVIPILLLNVKFFISFYYTLLFLYYFEFYFINNQFS